MSIHSGVGVRIWNVLLVVPMMALASACGQPDVDPAPRVALLAPDVPVSVTGGDIVGAFADGSPEIVAFKGVPYAAPPVGDLRWKPPAPVVGWDGVRDATAPGPICMQTGPAQMRSPPASETRVGSVPEA